MPATALREAHIRNLKAAVTSCSPVRSPTHSDSGISHASPSDWLRHESELIKEVDPSFDPALICPISFSPSGTQSPTFASNGQPSPLGTHSCEEAHTASPPRGKPSSPWSSPAVQTKGSPTHSPLLLQAMRAISIQDGSRSLVRCTSDPVERAQHKIESTRTSGSGPLLSPLSQQQCSAAKTRFIQPHRLKEGSSSPSYPTEHFGGGAHKMVHHPDFLASSRGGSPTVARSPASTRRRSLDTSASHDAESARITADSARAVGGLSRGRPDTSSGQWETGAEASYAPSPGNVRRPAEGPVLARVQTSGAYSIAASEGVGMGDNTRKLDPCLNFRDVERASSEMDEAGDVIESITIIPLDDSRGVGGKREGKQEVLFAISSGNARPVVPGFQSSLGLWN